MQIILPILLILSGYYFSKFIRINSIIIYVLAILLASVSILSNSELLSFITSGYLGLSFYLVVMFISIFKSGSNIKKQLSSVRKDYAILGFIFITPHAYLHILDSINNEFPIQVFGLLAFILMTPLFISSFKIVKNKIPTSNWIKLHRLAYLIYILLFFHLINKSMSANIIIYYMIFALYSFFILKKRFTSHRYFKATTFTIIISSFSLLFVTNIVGFLDKPIDIIQGNEFEDGVYVGYAKGYQNLEAIVRVNIKNNQIEYVIIDECGCTPYSSNGYYNNVAYQIASNIKNENRTDIDSISGATQSCVAINKAVIDALNAALIK